MVIRFPSKVNEFMFKNDEYGTTTSSKKTPLILKSFLGRKIDVDEESIA